MYYQKLLTLYTQAKLDGSMGALVEAAASGDLQIKRAMLELMREIQRIYHDNMLMGNNNIATITNTMKDGFDVVLHCLN